MIFIQILRYVYPDNKMSINASNTVSNMSTFNIGPPPVLRRETASDYIIDIPPRQDTLVLPPPVLRREIPEDYIFDPNSFISPDRIRNIQMPGTPVANRNSERDLSHIRPRRLHFN
jgi:hypothetical protein